MTSPEEPRSDLSRAAVRGVTWNAIGQIGRQGLTFVASMALARLLTPEDFGMIAVLAIFQEASSALVNSGLNAPLVQRRDVSEADISTVFYFNIAVGALCYAALVVAAPWIAAFYREPALERLVPFYGIAILVYAAGNVQAGLLTRVLAYPSLNAIDVAGVMVSSVVAVLLAYDGFGAYSLVFQQLAHASVVSSLYWLRASWRPRQGFNVESFRSLWAFGSTILVVSLLDKTIAVVDNLIVGRTHGTSAVGIYARGKNTRDLVLNNLTGLVTSMVFPLFSRIEDLAELKGAQRRLVGLLSYIVAPLMAILGLVAEPLIVSLYSEKWAPAAPYLQIFCLFGITVPLNSVFVQTIMSRGDSSGLFRLELGKKALLVVALASGASWGPVGIAVAMAVAHYAMLWLTVGHTARLLQTTRRETVVAVIPGIAMTAAMSVPVLLLQRSVVWSYPLGEVLATAGLGAAIYLALSLVSGSADFAYLRRLVLKRA